MAPIAIVAAAGFVALGLVVGLIWWLVSWARASSADARAQEVAAVRRDAELERRADTIATLLGERDRAVAAAAKSEEVANRAIENLAKNADASTLVDALNAELQAISALSELPAAGAGAAAEGGEGPGAVHGATEAGGGAGDRPDQ